MRRLLPLAVALGFGLLALLWGLATLESIVIDERQQAREGIESREAALAEYARRTLELRLQAELHDRREAFEQAIADPMAPTEGLLLVEDGQQRLPRRAGAAPGDATPARDLYEQLRQRVMPPDLELGSPPRQRVELYLEIRDALDRGVRSEIEQATWALLRHRTMFVLDSTFDVPLMVALLDDFVEHSRPAPQLLAQVLRDGHGRKPNASLDALQRLLLRRRDRFSAADLQFLSDRIVALSRQGQVPVDDFEAAVRQPPAATVPRPAAVREPLLLDEGRWYVVPHTPWQLRGVAVDLPEHVRALEDEMRRRGLLEPEDALGLPPIAGAAALSTLPFEIDAPRLRQAWKEAEERFWLKTSFVGGCAGLALGIVVLALLLQRRRHRFVELKSDFVATVSHELRTPLASIRLRAETLQRRTKGVPAARDYPQRIVRDIDELAFLVENILSFNRLDKGRWVPRRADVELRPLLDEVIEDL
ncbi:MAG: sensor histidine kinase, partial [Myxococcales bacterium]|nr:sensor histidine kinase [Myxococcales bacterium]